VIGEFGSRRGDREAWLRELLRRSARNPHDQKEAIAYL
jgi:hypothetical protein